MGLDPEKLKKVLMENIDPEAKNPLGPMGDAIAEYIEDNAEVSFSWDGKQLPGAPPAVDTTKSASGEIQKLSFNLTPSKAENQKDAMAHMKKELIIGLKESFYNITETGFLTKEMPMSSSDELESLNIEIKIDTENKKDDRDEAMLQLARCIIDWVKAQKPEGVILGAHNVTFGAPMGTGGTVTGIE